MSDDVRPPVRDLVREPVVDAEALRARLGAVLGAPPPPRPYVAPVELVEQGSAEVEAVGEEGSVGD